MFYTAVIIDNSQDLESEELEARVIETNDFLAEIEAEQWGLNRCRELRSTGEDVLYDVLSYSFCEAVGYQLTKVLTVDFDI